MNIKELRKKKNLSQEELSEQTGIPRARISKWESGKGNPKTDDAKILENFFSDVDLDISTNNDYTMIQEPSALEQAVKNLSEAKLIDSRNMADLLLILKIKFGIALPEMESNNQTQSKGITESLLKNTEVQSDNSGKQ